MSDDELWDLTDSRGNRTGATHRRGSPDWPVGYFHVIAATCVIRDDGLLLLTKRSATKDHPLSWEFPAGSALVGEASVEAALRELREETGLIPPSDSMRFVGRFVEATALLDLYTARVTEASSLSLDPDEVADAEWLTLDEVDHRRRAGRMAAPWESRLDVLWPRLAEMVRRASLDGDSA